MSIPILGLPSVALFTAEDWAEHNGASDQFLNIAELYYLVGEHVGVRPDVAYAQAAHETGFGRFGGTDPTFSATPAMHNFCGLKTHDGSATATFADDPTGVVAHLQHLALYAGAPGYPLTNPVDPRAFPFLLGKAPTVEALGGTWAPDPSYGTAIVQLLTQMGAS